MVAEIGAGATGGTEALPFPAVRPPAHDDSPERRTIALIAHDAKKRALLGLARAHIHTLVRRRLLVTATTGRALTEALGLQVEAVASGPEGGDLQIGARIVAGDVDAVIFLRDPLTAHPHEPDIQALLKVCDVHSIPVATNLASAGILLRFEAERDWCTESRALAGSLAEAAGGVLPFEDDRGVP
ncbi:MAG: methylglyoxal synthase [Actinomycetota bacterium]